MPEDTIQESVETTISSEPQAPIDVPDLQNIQPEQQSTIFKNDSLEQSLKKAFENADGKVPEVEEGKKDKEPPKESGNKTPPRPEVKKETNKKEEKVGELADPSTIQPPKGLSQKSVEGWEALKREHKAAYEMSKRQSGKIKELEAIVAERNQLTAKEVETLKKQVEELSPFRSMIDIQHDPEFIKNHDEPMNNLHSTMVSMLQKAGVSEETIKMVDFGSSEALDRIALVLEEKVDRITGSKFQKKAEDYLNKMEDREKAIADAKSNFTKYRENREKQETMSKTEEGARLNRHLEKAIQTKDESGNALFPFFHKKEAPIDATPAQIAQIEQHNSTADFMHKNLQMLLAVNKPEDRAEVAIAAATVPYLRAEGNYWREKAMKLEGELKKVSSISSEKADKTPSSNSPRNKSARTLNLNDAMSEAFPGMK